MKEQSNNFANGGGISTSSPYALQKIDNWNQIPSTWKNTDVISRVKFELNPLDKKFQSIFNGFLGDDPLRPLYGGYSVDEFGIAFTNAHILGSIPAKIESKGIFLPTGEKQEGNYPKYENIIPQTFAYSHEINCYKLLQYCKVAINYTYPSTKQIRLLYENFQSIGFDAEYLIIVLESLLKLGYEKAFFKINDSNKAVVLSPTQNPKVGEDIIFLVMPVIINRSNEKSNKEERVGAMDIDNNLELNCIFDLYKDEILNKDGSIAEFKMNYGSNPIFTDEVVKIIKSSMEKKPTLLILENFKVQDGLARTYNLKGYSYGVVLPNINVPDGLYYIKNNVAVKNENADADDFVKEIDYKVQVKRNSIKIKKDYFKYLINISELYIGNDELRPAMTGINFHYDSEDLYVASTNAHYLCRLKVEEKVFYENNNSFDFILPINNLNTLLDNSEDDYVVLDIYTSDYDLKAGVNLKIETNSFTLEQRLIDGKYPNVNAVIPIVSNKQLNLNKKDILNALKSKEAESFVKKYKKLFVTINGKIDGNKLSVNLVASQSLRDTSDSDEKIEILKTDLFLNDTETTTTNSCLLMMPVFSDESHLFNFQLYLFKDFIKPINTDYFELGFTDNNRAYIINEKFFKYEDVLTKPAKQIKKQEIVKPLIQKIEKKETPAETKSEKIIPIIPKNYELELDYKVGQKFEKDIIGGTTICYIKSIDFKVDEVNGFPVVDSNSYRIEYVEKGSEQRSHFSFLNKLKKEKNKIKIEVPFSIGGGIFFENSQYDNDVKLLNGKVNSFKVSYYGTYNWFTYYVDLQGKSYIIDRKDAYISLDSYINKVSSKIQDKLKNFEEPKGGEIKVKLDYKIGQKIKIPIIGGVKDSEITGIDIVINAENNSIQKDWGYSNIKYKNIYKENGEDISETYQSFEEKKYTNTIQNEIKIDVKALYLENYLYLNRYMDGSKLSINNVRYYILKIDKNGYKVEYYDRDINSEIFTSIADFKEKISSNNVNEIKSKKEESYVETKSDLEFLKELLATSNDLLDLISDTGSESDINFLKEKIEATKDLISLLQ